MVSAEARTPVSFAVGDVQFGGDAPLFLIAGPCVIESEAHATSMAEQLGKIAAAARVPLIFKASYDKANRSSVASYRGPGLKEGLRILAAIKKPASLAVLNAAHEVSRGAAAAELF